MKLKDSFTSKKKLYDKYYSFIKFDT